MERTEETLIAQLSFELAIDIIRYVDVLELGNKTLLAAQLFKTGTSICRHIRTAQKGESEQEYVEGMNAAMSSVEETDYYLLLCQKSFSYPDPTNLIDKTIRIKKLLAKIISTVKIR